MQYTLILTEKPEGGIRVTIPALPACRIEATTRDEAIRLAREAITQLVSVSEIVQIDIPLQPRATTQPRGVPWSGSGRLKPIPPGMPSSMTSSSAARPQGIWNSAHVSLGREYSPRFWAGPRDIAFVSAACAVV